MSRWLDVSVPLVDGTPAWPGRPTFQRTADSRIEDGDRVQDSAFQMDAHTGTHVDAPAHYLGAGATVERLDPDAMLGPALVVPMGDDVEVVRAGDLEREVGPYVAQANATDTTPPLRLLLRTANRSWFPGGWHDDFVALDESASDWCVTTGIRLVGIDALSIQAPTAGPEVHRILLRAGVVVVEGLDLRLAEPGWYDLACLPLRLEGAEGAPARAMLRPRTSPTTPGGPT